MHVYVCIVCFLTKGPFTKMSSGSREATQVPRARSSRAINTIMSKGIRGGRGYWDSEGDRIVESWPTLRRKDSRDA